MKQRLWLSLAAPALAIGVAVVISAAILSFTDYRAFDVFHVIVTKGFSKVYLIDTVNRAAPYYISGVSVAIGFKMNLFNIGVEGQYKLGALLGAAAGAAVPLPGPLRVACTIVVAMAVGAIWAAIPGVLRASRGVSEVISTIMLNSIALGLGAFLLGRWLRAPASFSPVVGSKPLPHGAGLPALNPVLNALGLDLPDANRVQSYLFVALLVGIAYYLIVWRTRVGFDLRATGSNAEAASASGVDAKRMIVTAMVLSGAIAGLIGLNNILGDAGRYTDVSVVSGLGFTGIAIALLGRNHPVGIAFAALLWAFMDAVQTPLSNEGLPKQITAIIQGITVMSVVIAYEVVRRIAMRRQAAALRRDDGAPPVAEATGPEVAPA